MIDENELEHTAKMRHSKPPSMITSQIELNITSIDESFKNLFPNLTEEVSITHYFLIYSNLISIAIKGVNCET